MAYLVRSFELMLEFVSHDWHVQPSCQRPNRRPPGRGEFSPGRFVVGDPTEQNLTVLETLQTYRAAENPVNQRNPQDFQMISTSGRLQWIGTGELQLESKAGSSPGFQPDSE